jgi:hypothetical protein
MNQTSLTVHSPKILYCAHLLCNNPSNPLLVSEFCPQSPALYMFGNSNCPGLRYIFRSSADANSGGCRSGTSWPLG